MRKILLPLLFVAAYTCSFSQPVEQYGCHFLHKQAQQGPWTAEKQAALEASNARSDTFDILNYRIFVDISDYASGNLFANTEVFFKAKIADIHSITLDLLGLAVDSIHWSDGQALTFNHNGISLVIDLPQALGVGESGSLKVWYHGHPIQSPSAFGGVYFESNYIFNLSIGLSDDPHNFGHAWFPCFDNFTERSTYELSFLTTLPYRAYAVGIFQDETDMGGSKVLRRYKMDLPLTTYHVSFAAANYSEIKRSYTSVLGIQHPLSLLAKPADTTKVKTAFLPYWSKAVDVLEKWYGPMVWDRVGYAMTTRGAMENPGNTIYPDFLTDAANLSSHLNVFPHELTHYWWGNVITVGSEQDMWIKEGPAEYGAHLFVEYNNGRDEFVRTVKANTLRVLKDAQYDDGAFLPLSPMPHATTYGTHTYYKGAMVMHNLRGYLGDTLFAQGMQHLQQALQYQSMDAYRMRDSLSAFTGYDLTNFFEDWVFTPGFSDFDIDAVVSAPSQITPGFYDVVVSVRQATRAAPHVHHNTPIEVNFRSATGQVESYPMVVPAESAVSYFKIPFEPKLTYLNGNQKINTACLSYDKTIKTTGTVSGLNVNMNLTVKSVPAGDSAYTRIEHHWTAPEYDPDLPSTVRISTKHFWRVDGIWPNGFLTSALMRYDRTQANAELDAELLSVTEDSLILLWRPDGNAHWQEHPAYTQLFLSSMTDGNGFIRIDTLYPGEYAFANGSFEQMSGVDEVGPQKSTAIELAPNPSTGNVLITAKNVPETDFKVELYDLRGVMRKSENTPAPRGTFSVEWQLEDLPAGVYFVRAYSAGSGQALTSRLVKQ